MKPSDFILNSDYMSIAQVGSNTFTVTVGGGTLQVNGYTEQNFDFAIKSTPGASDRVLISRDGGNYTLGSYRQIMPVAECPGFISVYRTAANNLRAQVVLQNYSSGVISYPAMTFTIKVSSFRPPNVF